MRPPIKKLSSRAKALKLKKRKKKYMAREPKRKTTQR